MKAEVTPPNQVTAFIAVGSNIEPEKNIASALSKLVSQVEVVASSIFYRTKALGKKNQPKFYNGVWQVRTGILPGALKFDVLHGIEDALGRVRTDDRYASRPIDLDLILYGSALIAEAGLRIPDSDIATRSFIAVPLLELAPQLIIPGSQKRLTDLPVAHAKEGLEALTSFTDELRKMLAGFGGVSNSKDPE
jgi:2-amino-4-hydroxy-6-hydroxymethyldihydropteridine diphosphokinase